MGIVSYSFSKECYKSGCLATGFPFITSQSVQTLVTLLILFPVSSCVTLPNLEVPQVELSGVPFVNNSGKCSPQFQESQPLCS